MQKYQILSKAGSGNFSDVYKARNKFTDQIVAIKQMKYSQDLQQLTYKQLQIISQLNHPNIIKTKQIIKYKKDVKVVFEYMDETLLELYQSSRLGINQNQIKCILYQTSFALDYLHGVRIIHRDIKPENLLINRKLALIKLIDFGLAKQDYLASTDYVATRWYRAPQNLLGMRNSSTSMDIFALGCVIAQLFTLNPLFPGDNTMDQLNKIINILGSPTVDNWPEGYKEAKRKGINLPVKSATSFKYIFPTASDDLIDLLEQMLQLNPIRRITARQIIEHPFFNNVQKFIPQSIYKQAKKYRQEYQSKKARKISPLNYSPSSRDNKFNFTTASLTSVSSPYSYQRSNIKHPTNSSPGKEATIAFNSRISIEGNGGGKYTHQRDLSTDSKKQLPKHWQPRKTSSKNEFQLKGIQQNSNLSNINSSITKNGSNHLQNTPKNNFTITGINNLSNINPSPKSKLQEKDKDSRVRHYFSRDHYAPNTASLQKRSSHKTKFFDSKGDSRFVTKTLHDDLKFNLRNTGSKNETRESSDIMKPSPRYNVKYFKQANMTTGKIDKVERERTDRMETNEMDRYERYGRNLDSINRTNRNKSVGMSLQPRGYLDKNKTFGSSKQYITKPIANMGFKKDYM